MISYTTCTVPQYIPTSGFSMGVTPAPSHRHGRPSIRAIQRAVIDFYGLREIDMESACRGRSVSWPRQMAMYLCRELTWHSLPSIGKHFGGRDHTTVMHALKAVKQRATDFPEVSDDLEALREMLAA